MLLQRKSRVETLRVDFLNIFVYFPSLVVYTKAKFHRLGFSSLFLSYFWSLPGVSEIVGAPWNAKSREVVSCLRTRRSSVLIVGRNLHSLLPSKSFTQKRALLTSQSGAAAVEARESAILMVADVLGTGRCLRQPVLPAELRLRFRLSQQLDGQCTALTALDRIVTNCCG